MGISTHVHTLFSRRLAAKKRDAKSVPLERETGALRNKLAEMAGGDEVTVAFTKSTYSLMIFWRGVFSYVSWPSTKSMMEPCLKKNASSPSSLACSQTPLPFTHVPTSFNASRGARNVIAPD